MAGHHLPSNLRASSNAALIRFEHAACPAGPDAWWWNRRK